MFIDSRKRSIARWAVVGLLVLCSQQLAAQTLTLNVPKRLGLNAIQTAATTIEFEASAIAGGANINVSGQSLSVPVVGCVGVACNSAGTTVAGDDLLLTRISGTNRVRLQLTYLSVTGNPTFCTSTIGVGGLSFPIELSGFTFGGGNGYRITSFMAPSDASCDIPYLRVPTNRPFVTVNTGTVNRLGRLPLNIVLVLDKSPSMGWTIPGSADIRWDRLKSSAQLFASVWDAVGAPPPPATVSSEGHPDDRLGLVLFGGTAVESPLDGVNFFKQRGANAAPWSGPVAAALVDGTFIGGTSIGAGTTNGKSRLDTVDVLTGDTAIVLFTDGEQNTPPCIIRDGETLSPTNKQYPGQPAGVTYLDQCTVAAAAISTNLLELSGTTLARDVLPRGPIYTIGLGEGGMAASAVLLDEISQETAGSAAFPNNGIALDTSFIDGLVNNLKGGTVTLLERSAGQLPSGNVASPPMTFALDPSLTRATFVLSWEGTSREVSLALNQPNGSQVTSAISSGGPNFRVVTVNLPANGPPGDWTAVVRNQSQGAVNYQVSAYGVESRFSSQVTQSAGLGTGKPIKITADLGWDNDVLADLPSGAVKAIIERPGANLGTLLHDATSVGKDDKVRDDTSPLAMKIDRLMRSADLSAKIEPTPLAQAIELKHVGGGRYEGAFDETNVGGRYRIRVVFDWNDPRTGAIHRVSYAERQVPVLPTATDSRFTLRRDPRTGDAFITVVPRDRFGNYAGPGFEGGFSVKTDKGTVAGPASDSDVTGEYIIRLTGLAPGDDPKVSIAFADQTIHDGALSTIGGSNGGTEPTPWWKLWWFWLILIFVLLLLLLLLRRK